MQLDPLLKPDLALVLPDAEGPEAVLVRIAEAAAAASGVDAAIVLKGLRAREKTCPTATPEGVALPHALLAEIDHTVLVPVLCRPGVKFGDEVCDLVVGMIGAEAKPFEHVRLLARLARVLMAPGALERIRTAVDAPGLLEALRAEDQRHG